MSVEADLLVQFVRAGFGEVHGSVEDGMLGASREFLTRPITDPNAFRECLAATGRRSMGNGGYGLFDWQEVLRTLLPHFGEATGIAIGRATEPFLVIRLRPGPPATRQADAELFRRLGLALKAEVAVTQHAEYPDPMVEPATDGVGVSPKHVRLTW